VLAVESVAGETMERLGYVPDSDATQRTTPTVGQRISWWFGDTAAWLRVEVRSLRKDRNVRLRWRRALMLKRIRLLLVFRAG